MPNMHALRRKLWGLRFNIRVGELEATYRASRAQPDRDKARLDRDWQALKGAVERGEASFTETDEEGQVIYDRGEHVGELMDEVEAVLDLPYSRSRWADQAALGSMDSASRTPAIRRFASGD